MKDWVQQRVKSFGYAFKGLFWLIKSQPNAQIHILAMLVVVATGFWLDFPAWKWCTALLCMGLVLALEATNTAIETLIDLVSPEIHPLAGRAKDVAAAAVLISAIFSVLVFGFLVFG